MGIVNVTPDSFSGDGQIDPDQAVSSALEQLGQGADLIDIGGQSTRPGHQAIDQESEAARVLPVIEKLRKKTDAIISIDTFNPFILKAALKRGADLLNSIWGLEHGLLDAVRELRCPAIIMHNKTVAQYETGVVSEVCQYLKRSAEQALEAGLNRSEIILDPGIGFGKTAEHNLELLSDLKQITQLGFPTLLGTSRKSTIGKLTGRTPPERVYGTVATVALGIEAGIDIMRVHDVAAVVDAVKVSDAIVRHWRPANWAQNN
jgi:dihydropteroate synthase